MKQYKFPSINNIIDPELINNNLREIFKKYKFTNLLKRDVQLNPDNIEGIRNLLTLHFFSPILNDIMEEYNLDGNIKLSIADFDMVSNEEEKIGFEFYAVTIEIDNPIFSVLVNTFFKFHFEPLKEISFNNLQLFHFSFHNLKTKKLNTAISSSDLFLQEIKFVCPKTNRETIVTPKEIDFRLFPKISCVPTIFPQTSQVNANFEEANIICSIKCPHCKEDHEFTLLETSYISIPSVFSVGDPIPFGSFTFEDNNKNTVINKE